MPHFTLEYSANLAGVIDIGDLVDHLCSDAARTGIFPLGGIRVRALRCDHYAIADGRRDTAFLSVLLRIGEGRDLAARQKAGAALFDALTAYLAPAFAAMPVALSFDIQVNDAATSWKANTIHDRLAAEAGANTTSHA